MHSMLRKPSLRRSLKNADTVGCSLAPVDFLASGSSAGGLLQVVALELALANGTLATFTEAAYPHLFRALQVQAPLTSCH